ncbi:MAG: RsfS/YbeB/iojap family protein [Chloroflexi bacterium]|nr:MAG: RsfS/YbeB/iojap family protein [Chloroflexota bacterium]
MIELVTPLQLSRPSGYTDGSWVVLDYASVIVHVFLPGERSYYDLESLWKAPARVANGNGLAIKAPAAKKPPVKKRATRSSSRRA